MAPAAKQSRRDGSLNLPSLLTVLWVFRRAKKGEDHDRPQILSTNAKSKAVLDRAKELACDGREDEAAVAELRALAGGRRRTLRQAERASHLMGYHHERAEANRASRLLKAALAGESVPPAPSAQDRRRIDAVEALSQLPRAEQWAQLTRLQPPLVELDADARAGRFGDLTTRDDDLLRGRTHMRETSDGERRVVSISSSDPPPTPEQMQRIHRRAAAQAQLRARLRPLVGPDSANDDVLLRSQRAYDLANAYLQRRDASGT